MFFVVVYVHVTVFERNNLNMISKSILSLFAKIKVFGVLPVHWPLILYAGTVLASFCPLNCAGFVYCHGRGRLVVLGYTQ